MSADFGSESATDSILWDSLLVQKNADPLGRGLDWAASSGFGPWALSRLAEQTGGAFIPLKSQKRHQPLLPYIVKPLQRDYRPDLNSFESIQASINSSTLRGPCHQILKKFNAMQKTHRIILATNLKSTLKSINIREKKVRQRQLEIEGLIDELLKAKLHYFESNLRHRANWELLAASLMTASYHLAEIQELYDKIKEDPDQFGLNQKFTQVLVMPLKFPRPIQMPKADSLLANGNQIDLFDDDNTEESGNANIMRQEIRKLRSFDKDSLSDTTALRKRSEHALDLVAYNHPGTPWSAMANSIKRYLSGYTVILARPPEKKGEKLSVQQKNQ